MTKEEAIKYLQQLYPSGGHCWLDEQRIEAIGMAIKALQEVPVSEDLGEAAITAADEDMQGRQIMEESNENRQLYSRIFRRGFKAGAKWKEKKMTSKAIVGKVLINGMGNPILHLWDKGKHLIDKKVKVLVIKEG